jgi:hypothetical protein
MARAARFLFSLSQRRVWWFDGFKPERKFLAFYVTSDRLLILRRNIREKVDSIQGFPSIHAAELRGIFIIITFFRAGSSYTFRKFMTYKHMKVFFPPARMAGSQQQASDRKENIRSPHTAGLSPSPNREYLLPLFFFAINFSCATHTHTQRQAVRQRATHCKLEVDLKYFHSPTFPPSPPATIFIHCIPEEIIRRVFFLVLLRRFQCCMRIYRRSESGGEGKYRINKEASSKKIEDEKRCRVINHIKGDLASLRFHENFSLPHPPRAVVVAQQLKFESTAPPSSPNHFPPFISVSLATIKFVSQNPS